MMAVGSPNSDAKFRFRVVAFDMDGVLVDIPSSWTCVHAAFGVNNGRNLRLYQKGEIDYKEFMRRDIASWGVVQPEQVKAILDGVPLMMGARETTNVLRKRGYRTAIISAGLSILAQRLQAELGIDDVFANGLEVNAQGFLTGKGIEIVELRDKSPALERLAETEGISTKSIAYVGDSPFDVHLFKKVGLSIAFNAADNLAVQRAANITIREKDLRKILQHLP